MFQIKLVNCIIRIKNRFPYVRWLCRRYHVSDSLPYVFVVSVSDEALKAEYEKFSSASLEYCESTCIYREIVTRMLDFDVLLLHGAVISCCQKGYLFTAPSGTGKSTHITFWRQKYGDKVKIINGDKPLVEYRKGDFYAYGTPWCGKEGWESREEVILSAICFLERGLDNTIERGNPNDLLSRLFLQMYLPEDPRKVEKVLALTDKLLKAVPFYTMSCNMTLEAAEIARQAMER